MSKINLNKIFPFSDAHLIKFKTELTQAGCFDLLMLKKKALKSKKGIKYISLYYDIEMYKRNFLIGVYESLRPFYDTEMPYVFWSDMNEALQKRETENK